MSINQQLGTPAALPGVDTPTRGDMDKLILSWARETATKLAENASKAQYTGGDIVYSVDTNGITFSFPAYMKYRDMKTLFWAGMPNVKAIEDWVRKKGVNAFAYVPGYDRSDSGALTSAPDAEKRIAFAIARNMAKTGEPVNNWAKYKRAKIWQNPGTAKNAKGNLGTSIGHLVKLIEEELAQILPNAIAYTFSQIK